MKTGKHWIGSQYISGIDLPSATEETFFAFNFLTKKMQGWTKSLLLHPFLSLFPFPLHLLLSRGKLPPWVFWELSTNVWKGLAQNLQCNNCLKTIATLPSFFLYSPPIKLFFNQDSLQEVPLCAKRVQGQMLPHLNCLQNLSWICTRFWLRGKKTLYTD